MNENKIQPAETAEKFEQWAIVELMGHIKYAGLVSEETIFGKKTNSDRSP